MYAWHDGCLIGQFKQQRWLVGTRMYSGVGIYSAKQDNKNVEDENIDLDALREHQSKLEQLAGECTETLATPSVGTIAYYLAC